MTDDELDHRLRQLGREAGPTTDPAFANRLETDLRLMGAGRVDLATARPWWQPVILTSVAVVFMLAGFIALRDRDQPADVLMTAAQDTMLVFPDGSEAAGAEGLELADGTRIVVGPDGSATVAGVVLAAGVEALVVDGHIEIVDTEATSDDADDAVQPETDPGSSRSLPSTTVDRSTTSTSRVSTTSTPATSTTTTDRPTSTASAPLTRPPPTTVVSTTEGPGSSTSTPGVEPVIELVIEPVGETRLRLVWSGAGLRDVVGWRVTATVGDRTAVVLVIRNAEVSEATLERLAGPASYQVLAIGPEGNVVAASNAIVP